MSEPEKSLSNMKEEMAKLSRLLGELRNSRNVEQAAKAKAHSELRRLVKDIPIVAVGFILKGILLNDETYLDSAKWDISTNKDDLNTFKNSLTQLLNK